jgi:hypothetical protein
MCILPEEARVVPPRVKSLERQIIQSYIWVLRATPDETGCKTRTLARRGAYEVRLFEPSQMPQGDIISFWLELFDHKRKVTLNSYGSDDLEQAAATAALLISEAERLDRAST